MTTWYAPSDPASIKPVPWLSADAIAYLESILTPDMNVIEHGSGGSTLWFAERVRTVTAYENNPEWMLAILNVEDRLNDNIFMRSGEPDYGLLPFYDLLLIDGEPVNERAAWIWNAGKYVKPGGWVVLDNANRLEYAEERDWLQVIAELKFTSKLQGAHLVTEFYQVK